MIKIDQNWPKCMGYSTRILLEIGHFSPNLRMFGNFQKTFLEEHRTIMQYICLLQLLKNRSSDVPRSGWS